MDNAVVDLNSDAVFVMFREIDKNDDNLLSHSELKKYLKKQVWAHDWLKVCASTLITTSSASPLLIACVQYCHDDEIHHTCQENDFHWHDLFDIYDSNHDGMIDASEFLQLYDDKLHPLKSKHLNPMAEEASSVKTGACEDGSIDDLCDSLAATQLLEDEAF